MPRLGSFSSRALTGIGLSILAPVQPMIMEVLVNGSNTLNFIKLGEGHDVEVDWGDGTIEQLLYSGGAGLAFHQYPDGITDTYTITISGNLPQYGTPYAIAYTNPIQGENFITRVLQWNSTTTNLSWAFEGQRLLTEVPDTLPAGVTNITGMFWGCVAFNSPIVDWDVSNVASMEYVFEYAETFNQNIGGWDTSNVTNMNGMFYGATSFTGTAPYLELIYPGTTAELTSNSVYSFLTVTNVSSALSTVYEDDLSVIIGRSIDIVAEDSSGYYNYKGKILATDWATGTNQTNVVFTLDTPVLRSGIVGTVSQYAIEADGTINEWDVSNVTSMNNMFAGCTSLDCYLGDWDVSSVTDMSYMFSLDSNFKGIGLSFWDVSSVTDMSYMFEGTFLLTSLSLWDVSSAINMHSMFKDTMIFNQPLGGWNVGNVIEMGYMFDGSAVSQNLSGWSVALILSAPPSFGNSSGVNPVWGTASTPMLMTWTDTYSADLYIWSGLADTLFPNACIEWGDGTRSQLTIRRSPPDSEFKSGTFIYHQYADIGTYTVAIRGYLPSFQGSMIGYGSPVTPTTTGLTAVTEWNSTTVNLYGAFEHRTALTSVPNYLPPNVTDIGAMFFEASSFNDPAITQWDTSNVTNMFDMFYLAAAFNQDLTGWDVTNIPTDIWSGSYAAPPALDPWNYPLWGTNGVLPPGAEIWNEADDFLGGGSSNWHDGSFGPGTQLIITAKSNNSLAATLRSAQIGDELYIAYYYNSLSTSTVTLASTFSEGAPDELGYIPFTAQVEETSPGFAQLINRIIYYSNVRFSGRLLAFGGSAASSLANLLPTYAVNTTATWTPATTTPASFLGSNASQWGYNLSAASSGTTSMIINGATGHTATTTDGVTWTEKTRLTPNLGYLYWNSLAYGAGKWVVVYGGTGNYSSNQAAYSTNAGTTWNYVTVPAGYWSQVVFGNGRFVCIDLFTPGSTMYSTDGITWQSGGGFQNGLPSPQFSNNFLFAGGSINLFMFVREYSINSVAVTTTADGITWSAKITATATGLVQYNTTFIAYGDAKLVMLQRYNNKSWTSTDSGASWTAYSDNFATDGIDFTGLYYFNGVFIATTRNQGTSQASTTYISRDGATWLKGGTSTGLSTQFTTSVKLSYIT